MKQMKKICQRIDTLNDLLGKAFSLLVVGILVVIMMEVILRRIFSKPQIWTQDMIVMLFACYVILIAAYGFLKKSFVAVDIIFAKLKPKHQYIMHLITYVVFFLPFTLAMLPSAWRFFYKAWSNKERGYSVWAPVVWPEKLCFFIGLLLLFAQGISEIMKQIVGIMDADEAIEISDKETTTEKEEGLE